MKKAGINNKEIKTNLLIQSNLISDLKHFIRISNDIRPVATKTITRAL